MKEPAEALDHIHVGEHQVYREPCLGPGRPLVESRTEDLCFLLDFGFARAKYSRGAYNDHQSVYRPGLPVFLDRLYESRPFVSIFALSLIPPARVQKHGRVGDRKLKIGRRTTGVWICPPLAGKGVKIQPCRQ